MTSTTSAGSGWKRISLGTVVPTDNEKLTLLTGATFSLEIDSLTRVRWPSLRLAETLTLDERDCAVLAWLFAGWAAVLVDGCVAALVFALEPAGDACDWLFVGGAVLVCAWAGEFDCAGCWADCACEGAAVVLLSDRVCDGWEGWFDCACERDESLPVVLGADWLVVVAGFDVEEGADWVFCADGVELVEEVDEDADGAVELELVWFCAAGGGLGLGCSLGDWANAPVPTISPMAVEINKCPFMFRSSDLISLKAKNNSAGSALFPWNATLVRVRFGTRKSPGTKGGGKIWVRGQHSDERGGTHEETCNYPVGDRWRTVCRQRKCFWPLYKQRIHQPRSVAAGSHGL
jgi:hypothetical protein